ncbi:Hypothetical predicted protein [Cloeon dipterum]|uniref:Uncharacterized protein n=1 Tax=Cloeon dipterum TaxID=197152 RepID=A0A8S1DN08_9INSE|nr:Hypothetical predicted protein [Cloeon dipterum]
MEPAVFFPSADYSQSRKVVHHDKHQSILMVSEARHTVQNGFRTDGIGYIHIQTAKQLEVCAHNLKLCFAEQQILYSEVLEIRKYQDLI